MSSYSKKSKNTFRNYCWVNFFKCLTFLLLLFSIPYCGTSFASDKDVVWEKGGFGLTVKSGGGLVIKIDGDIYTIESSFSFPSRNVGYNRFLSEEDRKSKFPANVKKIGKSVVEIKVECEYYYVIRTVRLHEERIEISETVRNKGEIPIGIMIEHKIVGLREFESSLFSGYRDKSYVQLGANPTVYLKGRKSCLGIVAEDSIFRLQLYSNLINPETAAFGLKNFALDSRKEHRFEWVIYPMKENCDYFSLINKIRRDWKTNFTIQGPFDFFDVIRNRDLIKDDEKLKAYFERKKVGILALTPWLDYDNFNLATGSIMNRDEYKMVMQEAIAAIKRIDRFINVIGCMQSNLISLPDVTVKTLYGILPEKKKIQGIYPTTKAERSIIEESKVVCKDSIVHCEDGSYLFELYYPIKDQVTGEFLKNAPPMMAIAVYAAPGNCQFKYWLDQARFMIENVGFDGIYIDQFSLAFNNNQRWSYDKWDGVTVDLDPSSGRIIRKYTDGALVGIGARQKLIEYVLSKGKVMVTNTHASVKEIQSAPIYRFGEGYSDVNPLRLRNGQKPPFSGWFARGHLGSPILLGFMPFFLGKEGKENYAKVIMKTIIMYLRNGMLYYCFYTEFPEKGSGAGDYGPINHMFPITVDRLGEGFIEGKERIVTAVSGTFSWYQEQKPSILLFDIEGRQKKPNYELVKGKTGWKVYITLADWEEIAIAE